MSAHMSNQQQIIAVIRAISGQSNILTIPRVFVTLTGSHRAALVLSQCVYWSDKGKDSEGWFWKTYAEWYDELGIPKRGMMTAIKNLKALHLVGVDVKKVRGRGAPTCHYRVNMEALVQKITNNLESAGSALSESSKTALSESAENTRSSIHRLPHKTTNGADAPLETPALSEAASEFFKQFKRKRWATEAQREKFSEAESKVGAKTMIEVIRWAATKGISDVNRIHTAAIGWGKRRNGGANGKHHADPQQDQPSGDRLALDLKLRAKRDAMRGIANT